MSDTPIANTIRALQARLGRPEWWTKGEFHRGEAACLEGAIRDVKAPLGVWDFIEEVAQSWASNDSSLSSRHLDVAEAEQKQLIMVMDVPVIEARCRRVPREPQPQLAFPTRAVLITGPSGWMLRNR